MYSGHKSILPWLSFPDKFKYRAPSVPVLNHLNKLILKLTTLVPASGWSSRWYLDFPLCCILSPVYSSSTLLSPESIAPKYPLSDICAWQPDIGIVDCVTRLYEQPITLQRVDLAIHGLWVALLLLLFLLWLNPRLCSLVIHIIVCLGLQVLPHGYLIALIGLSPICLVRLFLLLVSLLVRYEGIGILQGPPLPLVRVLH